MIEIFKVKFLKKVGFHKRPQNDTADRVTRLSTRKLMIFPRTHGIMTLMTDYNEIYQFLKTTAATENS